MSKFYTIVSYCMVGVTIGLFPLVIEEKVVPATYAEGKRIADSIPVESADVPKVNIKKVQTSGALPAIQEEISANSLISEEKEVSVPLSKPAQDKAIVETTLPEKKEIITSNIPVQEKPKVVNPPAPVQEKKETVNPPAPVQEKEETVSPPVPVREEKETVPQPVPVQEEKEMINPPVTIQEEKETASPPTPVLEKPTSADKPIDKTREESLANPPNELNAETVPVTPGASEQDRNIHEVPSYSKQEELSSIEPSLQTE